ncbi:CDGSH iron-sulfur domain-containing protein [Streptomyces sp. NPDC057101]|uniref:CDGSH iron-sulfur domain-containing protein n=1 Tax=Streptomyces sp. NPDC057101 TaxID=3346020 RepID=UPI00363AE36D
MSVSPDVNDGVSPGSGTRAAGRAAPRVEPLPEGPLLMEGPADIVMPDGSVVHCDRPMMALCTCRRSLRAPFCDTSHRPRLKRGSRTKAARGPRPSGTGADGSEADGSDADGGEADGSEARASEIDGSQARASDADGGEARGSEAHSSAADASGRAGTEPGGPTEEARTP